MNELQDYQTLRIIAQKKKQVFLEISSSVLSDCYKINQNYRLMMVCSPPLRDAYVRDFMSAAKVGSRQERGQVRELFRQKLSQHIGMLQHHQLREDRFALAHQLALQDHHHSALRAKEFLQLRQNRARANKSHTLLERSRRAEDGLARWESIVDRNREKYERELEEAKAVIRLWDEKLAESGQRKSSHLEGVSKQLKLKLQAKEKRIMTLRLKRELSPLSPRQNPEQLRSLKPSPKHSMRRQSRVSTESFLERRRQEEEEQVKESIVRTVGKEERINQARYMRHYYQERRRKQQFEKEEVLKAMRENHLTALRDSHEQRAQLIERRLSKERPQEESSKRIKLPAQQRKGTQSLKVVFNGFGEETVNEEVHASRNYSKLMTEKLKDITSMVRKVRSKP